MRRYLLCRDVECSRQPDEAVQLFEGTCSPGRRGELCCWATNIAHNKTPRQKNKCAGTSVPLVIKLNQHTMSAWRVMATQNQAPAEGCGDGEDLQQLKGGVPQISKGGGTKLFTL